MGKTTTSLKIDEDVWKKMKIKCIEKDLQITQGLEEALTEWIKKK